MKSINPGKSVIQTCYDIVKAHGGTSIDTGMKVKTKDVKEAELIIILP